MNVLLKSINPSNKTDSANIINDVIMLHKKGIITDDELATLIRVLGAEHFESEITNKVNEALEGKIYPYLKLMASYV